MSEDTSFSLGAALLVLGTVLLLSGVGTHTLLLSMEWWGLVIAGIGVLLQAASIVLMLRSKRRKD